VTTINKEGSFSMTGSVVCLIGCFFLACIDSCFSCSPDKVLASFRWFQLGSSQMFQEKKPNKQNICPVGLLWTLTTHTSPYDVSHPGCSTAELQTSVNSASVIHHHQSEIWALYPYIFAMFMFNQILLAYIWIDCGNVADTLALFDRN